MPPIIDWKEKLLIICVLLLALCMRIHFMTRGFFYDELYLITHSLEALSLPEALYKDFSTANHLGYTAIAYLTCHLLGTNEWTLRLAALLFGLGSIFLFWQWSRKYFGKSTAILGSLFLTLAPAHMIWSASGRGYSACIFFTILSTSLYFSLLEKPSLKTSVMLALANTFGFSFQILFLFLFLVQVLHFLLASIRFYSKHEISIKKDSLLLNLLSIFLTILFSVLIYLPTLPTLKLMSSGHNALVADFPLTLLRDLLSLPLWPLGLSCLILMFIGFMFSNQRLPYWKFYVAALFFMVFPLWLSKPVYLFPRFFAFLLPFFFLLLSQGIIGIVERSSRWLRPFVMILLAIVVGFVFWVWLTKSSKIVENFYYKFRESVKFAESVASKQTSFCAFGPEDGFYQVYSHRPVVRFKTLEEFQAYYNRENEIICFAIMGPPMPDEHKKILLFTLTRLNPKVKSFDNVIVYDLKDNPLDFNRS